MFIVWGTKVRRRRLGYRADFCRLCRRFRPFRVEQIEIVPHIYYIPCGSGTVQGHAKTCQECGTAFEADFQDATECSRARQDDVAQLISRTNPQIEKNWSARLELEQRVKSRKLTKEERESLILEPFLLLNPLLQGRTSEMNLDKVSGLGCLATILIPFGVFLVGKTRFHAEDSTLGMMAWVLAGLLALFTIGALATDGRRFARSKIIPKLAAALRPLAPSHEEIDQVLARLKQMGWAIGKKVKTDDITSAMQDHVPFE
jgi:hypothetical protein